MVIDFLNYLQAEGIETGVCVHASDGPLRKEMESTGAPVFRLRASGFTGNLLRTYRTCRQFAPDVVHAHNTGMALYAGLIARAAGARSIVTRHGMADASRSRSLYGLICDTLNDQLVAVSDGVAKELRKKANMATQDIHTVPNGIEYDRFARDVTPWSKKELVGAHDCFLFGSVGGLRAYKAQDVMIEALYHVRQRGGAARLAIAGEGYRREVLENRAKELGIEKFVAFTGRIDTVPEFLSALDAFLFSSVSGEGLPIALLEAMATGLPVVATRIPGVKQVITPGVDGLLVPPHDAEALSERMGRLMRDPEERQELSEAAADTVRTSYSCHRMVHDYIDLYVDIARKLNAR